MKAPTPKIIPLKRALLLIFASTFLVSGSLTGIFLYTRYQKSSRLQDPAYHIFAIAQTTSEKETLKTAFLAELLDLSVNRPMNLYQFNSKEAESKLLAYPLISKAFVKKIRPGIIHVDYSLRKPIAFLADFKNTLIDAEGVSFPFKPFFTPKKYPQIYLGIEGPDPSTKPVIWGKKIQDDRFNLACDVLRSLELLSRTIHSQIFMIDVSKAFAQSYGERQIVLIEEQFSQNPCKRYLRISTENYHQNLADYVQLRKTLTLQSCVIDFRIPKIAYLETL